MKLLINILLIISILFSGLNTYAFGKKNDVSQSSESVIVTKKEKTSKVKKERVKKEKVKKEKPDKVKNTNAPVPQKEKLHKKQKKIKQNINKTKKEVQNTDMAELDSVKKEKPIKNKKNNKSSKLKSQKELQNMTQTEREMEMVNAYYHYNNKQRSKLAVKLNPNLDVLEIRASHILVRKRKDAVSIRKDILNGVISFEDAAMQYSLCPTSVKGGDLGYFNRKRMDQSFTDRAFDLKIGEISEPVGTKFGWHLIKVVDKR